MNILKLKSILLNVLSYLAISAFFLLQTHFAHAGAADTKPLTKENAYKFLEQFVSTTPIQLALCNDIYSHLACLVVVGRSETSVVSTFVSENCISKYTKENGQKGSIAWSKISEVQQRQSRIALTGKFSDWANFAVLDFSSEAIASRVLKAMNVIHKGCESAADTGF